MSQEYADGFDAAIQRACKQLEDTAADFEEMYSRMLTGMGPNSHTRFGYGRDRQDMARMKEKAELLRGQAGIIRAIDC